MLLTGKVALVTGGGRGIGAAIARTLAREGATVAVNYAQSREKAEEVVAQIRANGGTAEAFGADVRCGSGAGYDTGCRQGVWSSGWPYQ